MHRMINHALHHGAITQPLKDVIQQIYEADCNIQAEVEASLNSPARKNSEAIAGNLGKLLE